MIVPEIGLKNENLKNDSEKIDIYIYIIYTFLLQLISFSIKNKQNNKNFVQKNICTKN